MPVGYIHDDDDNEPFYQKKAEPEQTHTRYVINRRGQREVMDPNKIARHIKNLAATAPALPLDENMLNNFCCDVMQSCRDENITTTEIDNRAASEASYAAYRVDISFGELAKRIAIKSHQKNTDWKFSEVTKILYTRRLPSDQGPSPSATTKKTGVGKYVTVRGKKKLWRCIPRAEAKPEELLDEWKSRASDPKPYLTDVYANFVMKYAKELDNAIDLRRDYKYSFYSILGWLDKYLARLEDGRVVEGIQHMHMRVAVGIHATEQATPEDLARVLETYEYISQKKFTHASPTLFNAGTPGNNHISCFLMSVGDTVQNMYESLLQMALIAKNSGGMGIDLHQIRALGDPIFSTGYKSSGLMPFIVVMGRLVQHIEAGGRRAASAALFLELHHPQLKNFLAMRTKNGPEHEKAIQLHNGLWIPDLFMKRLQVQGSMWTFFSPLVAGDLSKLWGDEYEQRYLDLESDPANIDSQVPTAELMKDICKTILETGEPYIAFKDSINRKSNQKHYGTITSLNLCMEIAEYHDQDEIACCTLASILLSEFLSYKTPPRDMLQNVTILSKPGCTYCTYSKNFIESHGGTYKEVILSSKKQLAVQVAKYLKHDDEMIEENISLYESLTFPQIFIDDKRIGGFDDLFTMVRPQFDYEKLMSAVAVIVRNLNRIIDTNHYPVEQAKKSNMLHRPLGIGVQGLADVFVKLRIAYDSPEAKELNKIIFATIYYAAWRESCNLAKIDGPYPEFSGSPASQGLLQFDLWNVKPPSAITTTTHFSYADNDIVLPWDELRADIVKFGARNSLLTALMPTAGTSVITGCAESFEPLSKIFFKRRLGRDFFILNAAFQQDMRRLGLMGEELINHLTLSDGEVSGITGLPAIIRKIYRTVNDVGEETCLEMAADRGPFVDQSQSSNIYIKEASIRRLAALLIKAWKLGLKTGSYYCRSKATTTRQNYGMTQDEESKYTTFDASSIVSRTSKVSKNEFDYLISDTSMATLGNDVCESCSS